MAVVSGFVAFLLGSYKAIMVGLRGEVIRFLRDYGQDKSSKLVEDMAENFKKMVDHIEELFTLVEEMKFFLEEMEKKK